MLGSPAARVPLCLQASGQCDLLRIPADFRLRRIVRRQPAVTIVFPQNNPVVRCPTRGAFVAPAGTRRHRATIFAIRLIAPSRTGWHRASALRFKTRNWIRGGDGRSAQGVGGN